MHETCASHQQGQTLRLDQRYRRFSPSLLSPIKHLGQISSCAALLAGVVSGLFDGFDLQTSARSETGARTI